MQKLVQKKWVQLNSTLFLLHKCREARACIVAYHQVPGCLFSAADPQNVTLILGVQHSEHSISMLQAGGSRKAKDMYQQSFKQFLQRHHQTVLQDPTGCMATSNYKRCSDLHPMCLVKIRASINTKQGKIVESRVK